MKHIQSKDNAQYKQWLKLAASARQRYKQGLMLLDGIHLLDAALNANQSLSQVVVTEEALQNSEVQALLARIDNAPTILEATLFTALSPVATPSGVLAFTSRPQPLLQLANYRLVLLLEAIQDPGNLGSLIRTAAAAGCDAVFCSTDCVDAWSPKVLRAAMGGHFVLPVFERQNLLQLSTEFDGQLLATSLEAAESLYQLPLEPRVGLMLGNEGAGLSQALQQHASQRIKIPMPGAVESLNVAAAGAVCLFELVRRQGDLSGIG